MKNSLLILSIFCTFSTLNAQIISQFTWDENPVTSANIGPNAIGCSNSAVSYLSGVAGTQGLNPGLPKQDLNMELPGSPTFDVPGIDIQIDFQRDENRGDFITRNGFSFGMNGGNLAVSFRVSDGQGNITNVNSGSIYSIPLDDTFRTYRFYYLPDSGTAAVLVDGVPVWTYSGVPHQDMYWTGGNLRIGNAMDGSGSNKTIFDNLIIAQVTSAPLPVEFVRFVAKPENNSIVKLEWETAVETNNAYFEVMRSQTGTDWELVGQVAGAGTSTQLNSYGTVDDAPFQGTSFYRLKQVDFDGKFSFSDIVTVKLDIPTESRFFPNPATTQVTYSGSEVSLEDVKVYDLQGKEITGRVNMSQKSGNDCQLDVSGLSQGIYLVMIAGNTYRLQKQ